MRQLIRIQVGRVIASVTLCAALALCAAAGPFTQLTIFGDSLSDVGNISQATASLPFVPTIPGPYYYGGRFSDGPVYAEMLAAGLDLPLVIHSRSGGNNFAYGGAKTTGTGFPNNLAVRDIDDQVGDFLGSRLVDANALFVVWAGSNDLIDGQTNVSVPVNRLATDIGRLIAAGARNFLVPNLPLLGYTPRYNGNATTLTTYNTRSAQFNHALATMLDGLETNHPAITTFRFDVAALFSQAVANPSAFGFTNATDAAAPGLQPGDSSYDTSRIAPNAHEYLFWDDLHPTTTAHAMLAQQALRLFALPGDFNWDGKVDAADYVLWRSDDGTPDGYDVWRANFGQSAGARAASAAAGIMDGAVPSVPEPVSICLVLAAVMAVSLQRSPRPTSR